MKQTVLVYNLNDKKRLAGMKKTLLLMGARMKMVPKEEYLRPIGQIFGLSDRTDIPVYEGEELEEEMIVMAGFNRMQIDNMLGGFRKNGVGTINIKAILTPTNGDWNAIDLFAELKKEHEIMHYEFKKEDADNE